MAVGARVVVATAVLATCCGQRPSAWGEKGHQMTARIAAERLTPAAAAGSSNRSRRRRKTSGFRILLG